MAVAELLRLFFSPLDAECWKMKNFFRFDRFFGGWKFNKIEGDRESKDLERILKKD